MPGTRTAAAPLRRHGRPFRPRRGVTLRRPPPRDGTRPAGIGPVGADTAPIGTPQVGTARVHPHRPGGRREPVVQGIGRGGGPGVVGGVVVQLPPPIVLVTGVALPLLAHAPNCHRGSRLKTGHPEIRPPGPGRPGPRLRYLEQRCGQGRLGRPRGRPPGGPTPHGRTARRRLRDRPPRLAGPGDGTARRRAVVVGRFGRFGPARGPLASGVPADPGTFADPGCLADPGDARRSRDRQYGPADLPRREPVPR